MVRTITANADDWEMIRLAWSSKAGLAMVPLQDVLNLGVEGRMNLPGTAAGNWRWRCAEEMLRTPLFDRLRDLTSISGRCARLENAKQRENRRSCAMNEN